jgi:lactoylglutathione lyase
MKAVFRKAYPYAKDAMNLPVKNIDESIPYYEKTFGFRVIERKETAPRSVVLLRDDVKIGLAENGGDPSQEGCFFTVENLEAAFEEIKGEPPPESDFRVNDFGGVPYRAFFEVAPDGLCYMIGEAMK